MEKRKEDKTINNLEKAEKNIRKRERKLKNFQRLMLNLIIVLVILWMFFACIAGVTTAPNDDMSPKIQGSDLLTYYRLNKNPNINDIIVLTKNDTTYVGRVVARGGDKVEILKTGGILVNDYALVENNIYQSTYPYDFVEYPLTLEEDEVFVLVDAREKGEDSRYYGPVKKDEIKGVVVSLFRRTGL